MPWRVSWFDEQETTILIKFMGSWSWREFEAVGAHGIRLMTSKPYTVHMICDITQGRNPPDNRVLPPVMRLYAQRPSNSGITVMVGATQFVELAISVITKVMGGGSHFRYADTVEEAAALLGETRVRNGS